MPPNSEHSRSSSQISLIDLSTSQTERINQETDSQRGRKSLQWFNLLTLRRLLFRFQYSRLRDYTSKGANIFHKSKSPLHLDQIPFPLLDKDSDPGQEWIKGVLLCAWGSSAILVLNVILAVIASAVAYTRSSDSDTHFEYAELYRGSCSITNGWATGMHLVINALSTALLSASNYSMQCLSAPSRADIDRAHSKRRWLDIGVFSARNLWVMDVKRKLLWVILFISSVPVHMMYNSAIFSSITTRQYGVVAISDEIGNNEPLTRNPNEFRNQVGSSPADVRAEYLNKTLKQYDVSECLKPYDIDYNTKKGTLLLEVAAEHINGSSIIGSFGRGGLYLFDFEFGEYRYGGNVNNLTYPGWSLRAPGNSTWLDFGDFFAEHWSDVHGYDNEPELIEGLYSDIITINPGERQLRNILNRYKGLWGDTWVNHVDFQSNGPGESNTLGREMDYEYLRPDRLTIKKCFNKDLEEQCQFYFSLPISLAVIGCNIAKVICMYLTARCDRKSILLTLGDGLSSFLHKPDAMTKGRCFMSRFDTRRGKLPWYRYSYTSDMPDTTTPQPVQSSHPQHLPPRGRWLRSPGWKPWTLTLSFFLACLVTSINLFMMSFPGFAEMWAQQMGKPAGNAVFFDKWNVDLILLILLVNSPQLTYSILYFLCNGLLTNMRLAAEFNDFATNRKPLRVSWPKGQQRSVYYISLPYRYGFPLIVVSIVMHWLLSQSLFLVKVRALDVHEKELPEESTTACGYANKAIFLTMLIGTLAMTVLIGLGFRRLRSDMPLASSCSAAISAACHPPPEDTEASLKPVKWGEIIKRQRISSRNEEGSEHISENDKGEGTETEYAHCSFTSEEVMRPSPNVLYC